LGNILCKPKLIIQCPLRDNYSIIRVEWNIFSIILCHLQCFYH